MKNCLVFVFVLMCLNGNCQNETIQAMIKQIALLQTYIGYLEKGYDIAKKGLNTIGDIKSGHWQLDNDFFNSLKNVNPHIKDYSKVAVILQMQAGIAQCCRQLKRLPVHSDEDEYIDRLIRSLLEDTETIVTLLETILTNQKLTLSDDERINTIDQIYIDVSDQYQFISSFLGETKMLILQRARETNDVNVLRTLINPQ